MGEDEKILDDLPSIDPGHSADRRVPDSDEPEEGEPTRREIGMGLQPSAAPAALSGRMVSHFRVGEVLGSGGMGVVYGAEDVQLGRSVALKFLAPELVRDPHAKARFLTEARAASALDHPNLCTILEVGETEEGLLFLAMPRYEGESLEHRLSRGAVPHLDRGRSNLLSKREADPLHRSWQHSARQRAERRRADSVLSTSSLLVYKRKCWAG